MMDKRVSRIVGWLSKTYPSLQLTVRYVPGRENEIADMTCRWSGHVPASKAGTRNLNKSIKE